LADAKGAPNKDSRGLAPVTALRQEGADFSAPGFTVSFADALVSRGGAPSVSGTLPLPGLSGLAAAVGR